MTESVKIAVPVSDAEVKRQVGAEVAKTLKRQKARITTLENRVRALESEVRKLEFEKNSLSQVRTLITDLAFLLDDLRESGRSYD